MRLILTLCALACTLAAAGESAPPPALPAAAPFQDNPAVVAKLTALGERSAAMLGKFKVEPAGVEKYHGALKGGPGRRDYGNKMAYAADRGTALYCGANHGSPHRLNDVWEFHLGSNTWRMICPPGTDGTRLRGWQNEEKKLSDLIAKGTDVEKNKAELEKIQAHIKAWYAGVEVKDGYLQDKANGGPVQPWHTWDGLTYDEKTRRLYWAELDSDNYKDEKHRVHRNLTRTYARATGQDPEKLVAELKPGSSMYMYDLAKGRWFKQLGDGPWPLMRGMGGTLQYIPDRDVTVWYACVGNVSGGYEEGMWAFDAKANRWTNLIPGGTVSGLMRQKKAPGDEIQAAYSPRHGKLVVVNGPMTFAYDFATNAWARVADNPTSGLDCQSVFSCDTSAGVCLLVGKKGGQWSKEPWQLGAYDVGADKWEVVEVKGDALPQDIPDRWDGGQAFSGYYDAKYNAFVLYCARSGQTWAYRHAAKK